MEILFLATKSPWPAIDGGRLALWLTMQGLARAGHELRLIAPVGEHELERSKSLGVMQILHQVCTPHWVRVPSRSWFESIPRALTGSRA